MPELAQRSGARSALIAALLYVLIGLSTSMLSRSAPSPSIRSVWRLAAWLLSAGTFAAHIIHRARQSVSARSAATLPAAAVALATLVLAGVAVFRQAMASTLSPSMVIAFVVWPILTGVPAFLVALAGSAWLRRNR